MAKHRHRKLEQERANRTAVAHGSDRNEVLTEDDGVTAIEYAAAGVADRNVCIGAFRSQARRMARCTRLVGAVWRLLTARSDVEVF
jgi:hypothetical protein